LSEIGLPTRYFVTGIEGSNAILPDVPGSWSFSSLKEIDACPKRYMLSRAAYPDLGVKGYPRLPSVPALIGELVHGALEIIVEALVAAGCESLRAPGSFGVLKGLGGITAVVDELHKAEVRRLTDNPRLNEERRRRLARDLDDGVADARVRVQEYLSRAVFGPKLAREPAPTGRNAAQEPRAAGRRRACLGANTEKDVASDDLRLTGRIDLLTVYADQAVVLDYKTGAEDPSHVEQLQMYALLWDLDRQANPDAIPATKLTAAYASHDVTISAPTPTELRELETLVHKRIAAADALFAVDAPPAKPSSEQCAWCQVRQLCDDYWSSSAIRAPANVKVGEWFDYEGRVGPSNGIRSVWMLDEAGCRELLLRITSATKPLEEGNVVRILGLRCDEDPEVPSPIAVMTARSEVFVLASSP
jgi:RecB family exonuclease